MGKKATVPNEILQSTQEEALNDNIAEDTQEEILNDSITENTQEETLNDNITEDIQEASSSDPITENTQELDLLENQCLIAITPILYHSKQYKIGDVLPASDAKMVQAWLDAGTAEWQTQKATMSKATSVVAKIGLSGIAIPSTGEDFIGRITGRKK